MCFAETEQAKMWLLKFFIEWVECDFCCLFYCVVNNAFLKKPCDEFFSFFKVYFEAVYKMGRADSKMNRSG